MLGLFLAIALTASAHSDPFDWEKAKLDKTLSAGVLGKAGGIPIHYRLGFFRGGRDTEVAFEVQWRHPSKKGCCEQELFRSLIPEFSSSKARWRKGKIVWDMVTEDFEGDAEELTRTKSRRCWKLDAARERFVDDSKCEKEWKLK